MFKLVWIWVLLALPLPVLAAMWLPRAQNNSTSAMKIPFFDVVSTDDQGGAVKPANWRRWVMYLIWLLLVFAACRPQWIGAPTAVPVSGRDLMLAVDVSASMRERDLVQNQQRQTRLAVVKNVAGDFIQRREGDRVGLIFFGTQAYLQTPLTLDRTTVVNLLQESAIGIAGKRTAIGDAIGLGVKRLRDREASHRVLILLTDGANTAGELAPLKAAQIAKAEGVTVHTIGVGSDRGATTGLFGLMNINPSMELDEHTLRKIAETTGGQYFRARDTQGLQEIYQRLDKLEPIEIEDKQLRPINELYIWPLALAWLLSVSMSLFYLYSNRKSQRASVNTATQTSFRQRTFVGRKV